MIHKVLEGMVGHLTSYYETYEFPLMYSTIKLDKWHYLFGFLCKHKVEGSKKTMIGQIFALMNRKTKTHICKRLDINWYETNVKRIDEKKTYISLFLHLNSFICCIQNDWSILKITNTKRHNSIFTDLSSVFPTHSEAVKARDLHNATRLLTLRKMIFSSLGPLLLLKLVWILEKWLSFWRLSKATAV